MSDVDDSVGLIYFDLHADMNTPTTVTDGALDWMGLAHLLALDGTEPALCAVGSRSPILQPDQVVLFGHGLDNATGWEKEQIGLHNVARVPVEDVRVDPRAAASRALAILGPRAHYIVHLDVDVIDFTDAPLSENTGRNTGLAFADTMEALTGLVSDDRLMAVTISELNPAHAAAEEGLLERFATAVADAMEPS